MPEDLNMTKIILACIWVAGVMFTTGVMEAIWGDDIPFPLALAWPLLPIVGIIAGISYIFYQAGLHFGRFAKRLLKK